MLLIILALFLPGYSSGQVFIILIIGITNNANIICCCCYCFFVFLLLFVVVVVVNSRQLALASQSTLGLQVTLAPATIGLGSSCQ